MDQADEESDEHLINRVCQYDHDAFAALVLRHTSKFYAAAYRMCGHVQDAEDIVQDAFLKIWKNPEAWDQTRGAKFTTWFYRVVINLAIDRARRHRNYADPKILDFIADPKANFELDVVRKQHAEAVEKAIQALPERHKAALNLCFYEGLSNREAAEILGVRTKALESLLMRGKAAVRDALRVQGILQEDQSHAG